MRANKGWGDKKRGQRLGALEGCLGAKRTVGGYSGCGEFEL